MSERGPSASTTAGELAHAVAERLDLTRPECEDVRIAAALHDVGKLAIPDSIVVKPGPLDEDEWSFIRRHPLIGERILSATPGLAARRRARPREPRAAGRRRLPDRLRGDAIPLGARIVAVCDAFRRDDLRPPVPRARCRARRRSPSSATAPGSQFDAAVVAAFEDALEAQAPADELAHDLVGPAADRAQPRIA